MFVSPVYHNRKRTLVGVLVAVLNLSVLEVLEGLASGLQSPFAGSPSSLILT